MYETSGQPRVSVLMSVFNGERYLREAVDSILSQTYRDFQFIIVNDASTDATADLLCGLKDCRVRILTNEGNLGLTRSLNRGLREVRGDYIARQDADDVSDPGRLERQVAVLESRPDVGLVGAAYAVITAMGSLSQRVYPPESDTAIRWQMLFHNAFAHSSVMFRRNLLGPQEGYDESLRYSQDYELWSRLLRRTGGLNLAEVLVHWRLHDSSTSVVSSIDQAASADRTSYDNMSRLCPGLPLATGEARELRAFYHQVPKSCSKKERHLLFLLWKLLVALPKAHVCDPAVMASLHQYWKRRGVNYLLRNRWDQGALAGRLIQAWRISPREVMRHAALRWPSLSIRRRA